MRFLPKKGHKVSPKRSLNADDELGAHGQYESPVFRDMCCSCYEKVENLGTKEKGLDECIGSKLHHQHGYSFPFPLLINTIFLPILWARFDEIGDGRDAL